MQQTFDHAGIHAATITTLRRDHHQPTQFLHALAHAHTTGIPIDWTTPHPTTPTPHTTDLPTYPFQRQRYWLPDEVPIDAGTADGDDAPFWEAVEHGDVETLAGTLRLPEDDGSRASLGAILPALSGWRRTRRERSALDSWRYRIEWRRLTDLAGPAGRGRAGGAPAGPWLIVVPAGGAGAWPEACAAALGDAQRVDLDPGVGRDELAAALRSRCAEDPPPAGVLSLLGLDEGPEPSGATAGVAGTLTLVQALVDAGVGGPLWCATRGAVSTGDSDPLDAPEQARLWGLGRVAALEHPEQWGGLLDLPASPADLNGDHLRAVLTGGSGEDQVALRAGGAFGRRLVPAPLGDAAPALDWRPEGTVLVTGGANGLAAHIARRLAEDGAERVVLLEPAGADAPGVAELVVELSALGAEAVVAGCDVTDRDGVAAVVERLSARGVRIGTIIHMSTSGELAPLAELTAARLAEQVGHDQAGAARDLAGLCGLGPDDTVVFFTSVAAVWGSRDHGAYAAANAYLDALAHRRRADGGRVTSIAWGLWDLPDTAGRGPVAGPHAEHSRRQGLAPLDPGRALTALRHVLGDDGGNMVIADVAWETFAPLFTLARPSRLFDGVPAARRAVEAARSGTGDDAAGAAADLRSELAGLAEDERTGRMLALVRTHAAAVLRYAAPELVGADRPFKELGFDSIAAVELRNRLRAATGVDLPPTAAFDHPTPHALAGHLLARVLPEDAGAEDPALAHLRDLEAALAVRPAGDPRRAGLVNRIRALLWRYESPEEAGAETAAEEEGDLAAATADEMFALIDRELGG